MKMSRSSLISLLIVILVMFSVALLLKMPNRGEITAWNIYKGEIPGYLVEIEESQYGNGPMEKIVHLRPLESLAECSWCSITGHDYDSNYTGTRDWERLFRCGYPDQANGCNAVLFTKDGVEWEPCPADAGKVEPFTDEEINYGLTKLDEAMQTIYNQEHLVSTLESWREEYNKNNG